MERVRQRVATLIRLRPQEIAVAARCYGSLQALIGGYKPIGFGRRGCLYSDLDYDSMQWR